MAGREKNCKWYFADQPNVQEVGPNNAMEQNFKHHPYASLVRESIQNSLDAVLDKSEPVRMEFSFKEMRGNEYPQFFELKNHIISDKDKRPKLPDYEFNRELLETLKRVGYISSYSPVKGKDNLPMLKVNHSTK